MRTIAVYHVTGDCRLFQKCVTAEIAVVFTCGMSLAAFVSWWKVLLEEFTSCTTHQCVNVELTTVLLEAYSTETWYVRAFPAFVVCRQV